MAWLRGHQGSITYAGSDGPTVGDVRQVRVRFFRGYTDVTGNAGWILEANSLGPLRIRGSARIVVNNASATHPIPKGLALANAVAPATLTFIAEGSPAQSYAFPIHIVSLDVAWSSSPDDQQYYDIEFISGATAAGDTVTIV